MKREVPLVIPRTISVVVDTSLHNKTSIQELIRRRAYEIFEARGRQSGHEVEDWLQAEREIKDHLGI